VLETNVPRFVPSPPAQLNTAEEKRDDKRPKKSSTGKFASEQSSKERANGHNLIVQKEAAGTSIRITHLFCARARLYYVRAQDKWAEGKTNMVKEHGIAFASFIKEPLDV
jgi:hypothetical protein